MKVPWLSGVASAGLLVAAVMQLLVSFFPGVLGSPKADPDQFEELMSGVAALTAAAGGILPWARARAAVSGLGIGAWAFGPLVVDINFVTRAQLPTVIHWVVLALILGSLAAGVYERRLAIGRQTALLLVAGMIGGLIVIRVVLAMVLIVVFTNYQF